MSPGRFFLVLRHLWNDVVHRARAERDLDDELRSYVDLAVAERVRRGVDSEVARREVLHSLRSIDYVKEGVRDTRRTAFIETLLRDVRYSLRTFARKPGFALVVVVTLAVGIGGATAVFSVVNAALLAGLGGVREPDRLVSFDRTINGVRYDNFGYPDFLDYQARASSLAGAAAYIGAPVTLAADGRPPERLRADLVTGEYFGVLGAPAAVAGRLLTPADDQPGQARKVVLSYGLWQREFGGRRDAVGASLQLSGATFTVVGVAARSFTGARIEAATDLWAPLSAQPALLSRMSPDIMQSRTAGWLSIVGRLSPGATFAQADGEVRTIAEQLALEYPATNSGRGAFLHRNVGLDPDDRADIAHMLAIVSAAVALLLLIACANVAGLLVVRSFARRHEMAARLALGASRRRLIRQLIVEGLLLASAGGAMGLTFAVALARVATRLGPSGSILAGVPIALDGRVLAVAAIIALGSGAVFTLAPALRASQLQTSAVLRAATPGAGGSRQRAQRVVVVLQVALSFALLVAASTLAVAMERLLARPPGFDPDSLVVSSIDLTANAYTAERGLELYQRLIDRLHGERALRTFAFAKTVPPLDWSDRVSVFQPGTEPPQDVLRDQGMTIGFRVQLDHVTPDYFRTLGIPLRRGREFTPEDRAGAPRVAIVNESMARAFWPDGDALGKRLSWPSPDGPPRPPLLIVGVAADHRYTSLTTAPAPLVFVPEFQAYDGRATIVARAAGDEHIALQAIARAVHDVDPDVTIYGAQTMRERMAGSVGRQRTLALWMGAFALLALAMSALGVYGVMAQSVGQRARELSVRLALGSTPGRLLRLVAREAAVIAGVGLAAGVPLAVALSLALREPLQGVDASAREAWLAGAVLLALMVLAASCIPARRAARVDPAEALRCE